MSDIGNQLKLFISSKRWMKKYFRGLMPEMAYVQVESDFRMYLSMVDISGPSFDLGYDKSKAFYQYEKADKDLIESHIKDGDVFLDVGANIGHFSFYFKKKYPNLTSHLFEPIPWLGDCINQTINENGLKNITHHSVALSDHSGEDEFFIDTFNDGGHSLIQDKLSARSKQGRSVKVVVKTLDEYDLQKVDFLKVDVQGAEKFFLKGALETLKKFKPKMLIEVAVEEVTSFIDFLNTETGINYSVFCTEQKNELSNDDLEKMKPVLKERGIQDYNFLFVPKQ